MRRRMMVLGVFLLLGVIVNVAVAWSSMVFSEVVYPQSRIADPPLEDERYWWARSAPRSVPHPTLEYSLRGRAVGMDVSMMLGSQRPGGLPVTTSDSQRMMWMAFDHAMHVRAGWPFRSLSAERWDVGVREGGRRALYSHPLEPWTRGDVERGDCESEGSVKRFFG
jgi:hypothetical protein